MFKIQRYSSSDQSFFFSRAAVLRQRAEEVANLEKELRELQITAGRLVEKRNQNQNHFEQTEGRLQKQQEGKYQLNPFLPETHLYILLCLTPDDFTRQRETPWQ